MANPCDISEESAVLDDALLTTIITTETDSAVLDDAITHTLGATLTDAAVLDDDITGRASYTVIEAALIAGNLTDAPIALVSITTETARLGDAITFTVADVTTEQAIITDASSCVVISTELELAAIVGSILGPQTVANVTLDAAIITDRLLAIFSNTVTETGVLDDASTSRAVATSITTEVAQLSGTLLGGARVADLITDTGVLDDAIISILRASNVTTEEAVLDDRLLVAHGGIGWAAPTDSFAMSRYDTFPMASLAAIDGYLVGANEDGLFVLAGDTDQGEPIAASIVGDLTDALDGDQGRQGVPNLRRPTYLHIGYATDGVLRFILTETESGAEVAHSYDLPTRVAAAMATNRVKLGRGLRSRFWRCKFENVAGSGFDINDGRIDFAVLQRRA